MKKFKKSYVILPAIATMALTTVASVTGTVAWFTAARTATVTASTFVTTKTESTLNVTCSNLIGAEGTSTNVVTVKGKMTHGSYDAKATASGSLYVASLDDSNAVTAYRDLGTVASQKESSATESNSKWLAKTAAKDEDKIWYGVAWQMNFTYTAGVDGETNYLLLDIASTTMTGEGHTIKGLRIAFMTADKYLVLSGGDGQTASTHVKGTVKEATEVYADTNYVLASASDNKLEDNASNLSSSKLSLGVLPSDGSVLSITCVAWFEGESDNVKNKVNGTDVSLSSVTSSLAFYSRSTNA